MTVRMTDEETWDLVDRSAKGILTTLRADGRPVALPVWYVTVDRHVFVSTRGKKVDRARNDPRCSFLVEGGDRWVELRAVHLDCTASLLAPDDDRRRALERLFAEKYAALRAGRGEMPAATRDHYEARMGAILELTPNDKVLTWDNRKLGVQ